jgi:ribosome-binding protein aMBF1 (putative translation factor)
LAADTLPSGFIFILCFVCMDKDKEYLRFVGMNIRKKRDQLKISQQELADNSNIAKSTVQRIEKGELNPSITILKHISDALNIDVSELLK